MIDKNLVLKSFKKSLYTYIENAIIQKEMAKSLINLLIKNILINFNYILEFGCGTGILTSQIHNYIQYNKLFANDIINECHEFINKIDRNIEFINGDIEVINLNYKFDLIISNATIQWINNFELLIEKFNSLLTNNGILAFSTFGENNFIEFKILGLPGLNYLTTNKIISILSKHFIIYEFYEEIKFLYFKNVIDILKHIKNTGVNGICRYYWTKNELNNFIKKYNDNFKTNKGLKLTYNPVYFILKRK